MTDDSALLPDFAAGRGLQPICIKLRLPDGVANPVWQGKLWTLRCRTAIPSGKEAKKTLRKHCGRGCKPRPAKEHRVNLQSGQG
ncbi:MAG: hypothetical protein DRI57_23365 [Deltaproteobacteria bacterium]|nr:MAG: hypothetical protein DRI57_23365 [Deltaproteobacteria bacterium]